LRNILPIFFFFSNPVGKVFHVEVDMVDTANMPLSIRARICDESRLQQFRNPSFFKVGQMKAGWLIVNDKPAVEAGFPIKDINDLLFRISQGEHFQMWPAAGWHTTTACQYWKKTTGKPEFYRAFDHIFLSSTMTEPDAMALGASQNYIEQLLESEVGNPNMMMTFLLRLYAYSQLEEMICNRIDESRREIEEFLG
jgi:hypothetical protein